MDYIGASEQRYEKVGGKWILKDEFTEGPKTKTIQKKWKERGFDGSIIECVDEVEVPIDQDTQHDNSDTIKEAFMKPLSMGDLSFNIEDSNYVAFQTMEERYFTRQSLNNYAIMYDVNYRNYKNKKLLIEALIQAWDDYFIENPDFKQRYYERWR
jgi:hypothetical protein